MATSEVSNFNADTVLMQQMMDQAMGSSYPKYLGSFIEKKPHSHLGYRYISNPDQLSLNFQGWWRNNWDTEGYFTVGMTLKPDGSWEFTGRTGLALPAGDRRAIGYQAIEFILSDPDYTDLQDMNGLGLILGLPEDSKAS